MLVVEEDKVHVAEASFKFLVLLPPPAGHFIWASSITAVFKIMYVIVILLIRMFGESANLDLELIRGR